MNLAIEYIKRSGTIKNFLEIPSHIFSSNEDNKKIVISITKASNNSNSNYKITHWNLELLNDSKKLPKSKRFSLDEDDLFDKEKLFPGGLTPIAYEEEPVDTSENSYNCPMEDESYSTYLSYYLNSFKHKSAREAWLWNSFKELYLTNFLDDDLEELVSYIKSLNFQDNFYKNFILRDEQTTIRKNDKENWKRWGVWKNKFLSNNRDEMAPELIFSSFSSF